MLQKSILLGMAGLLFAAAPALAASEKTMPQQMEQGMHGAKSKASAVAAHRYLEMAYNDAVQVRTHLQNKDTTAARESLTSLKTNLDKAGKAEKNAKFQAEIANVRREQVKLVALIKTNPEAALEESKVLVATFKEPMSTLATMGGGGGGTSGHPKYKTNK